MKVQPVSLVARLGEQGIQSANWRRAERRLFPGKVSLESLVSVRTANRHRWVGRVYQGRRVMLVQGTRQKSGRKLCDKSYHLRVVAANVYQPTVYHKHRLLQNGIREV